MDTTAIAGLAARRLLPDPAVPVHEALGQEVGKRIFSTMMQGASLPPSGAKARKPIQALPLELLSDQFVRDLAAQHQQHFARLLLGSSGQEGRS